MENGNESSFLGLDYVISQIKSKVIKTVIVFLPLYSQPYSRIFPADYFLSDILNSSFKHVEPTMSFNLLNDPIPTEKLNSEHIYDIQVEIDKSSFRDMKWIGPDYLLCFGIFKNSKNTELHWAYPRNILLKTLNQFKEKYGYIFQSASELEYYIFNNKNTEIIKYPSNLKNHLISNLNADYNIATLMMRYESFNKIFVENLKNCGIKVESIFSEYGPGQFEINIKYCETSINCDNHILTKNCMKFTAHQLGKGISFMAKPFNDLLGSSCHIHISIIDEITKLNLFSPPVDIYDHEYYVIKLKHSEIACNIKLIYFIGGILKYIQDLFICYAPTVNSYRRFKKYSHAPYYIDTWCYDSKSSSLKVIGEGKSIHLEIRTGGADVNPYIAHTAIISSGMKGIEEKIMPPKIQEGNTYEKSGLVSPPGNLYEAAKYFEKSNFSEEVFGKDFKELILNHAFFEWNQYVDQVSEWEINRYFDLV